MQFHRWLTEDASDLHALGADLDALRRDAALHLPNQVERFRQTFKASVGLV